jgi:hypothetical protein
MIESGTPFGFRNIIEQGNSLPGSVAGVMNQGSSKKPGGNAGQSIVQLLDQGGSSKQTGRNAGPNLNKAKIKNLMGQ